MAENHINKKGLKRLEKRHFRRSQKKKLQAFFVVFRVPSEKRLVKMQL